VLIRPRLAWPFTIVPRGDGDVWLVAGEDVRFTLRAEHAADWLPALLARCRGAETIDALLAEVAPASRAAARELLESLAGERILVEGEPLDIAQRPASAVVEGSGRLADALRTRLPASGGDAIHVLAQDDLDYASAVAAGRRWRGDAVRGLWTSIGPLARAYVGPVMLPDAGPCLTCLLGHFRLLSPVPEVYDVLLGHNGAFAPAAIGDTLVGLAADLVAAKLAQLGAEPPSSTVFALHVIEAASLEVTSHRVFRDSECTACAGT